MYDSLDEQLVQLLGKDARQTSKALAKQLKVSAATVRRRVGKLIQSSAIRIVAVADSKKIGFPLTAIIAFDVSHEKIESAMQMLASREELIWVSTTTGRFDILALAIFRSTDELSNFVQRDLANIEGLRGTETFICLHIEKGQHVQA